MDHDAYLRIRLKCCLLSALIEDLVYRYLLNTWAIHFKLKVKTTYLSYALTWFLMAYCLLHLGFCCKVSPLL